MIYFLYGDTELVLSRAEEIIEELKKESSGQMETRKIDLKEEKIDDFLNQLSISLFGNQETVLLFHAEKLSKKDIDTLRQIYQQSKEKNLIVLAKELKPQHPLLKPDFLRGCKEVSKIVFDEELLRKKIQDEFKKYGKKVSNKLAQALINLYGSNLSVIKQEIKKIALFFTGKNKITGEELKILLSESTENLHLKFFKALAHKNKKEALRILSRTVVTPSDVPSFLSRTLNRLRLWLKVRAFTASGTSDYNTIARELDLNPYYIRHLISESRNFSLEELENALIEGLRLDYLLKTGKISPSGVPAILLEKILQQAKKPA